MWIKIKFAIVGFLIGITISGLVMLIAGDKLKTKFYPPLEDFSPSTQIPKPIETFQYENIAPFVDKIEINKANKSDLESLPGIGSVKAQSIIDFRTTYGSFQEIEELIYVTGISQDLLQSIMSLIYIE